MCVFVKKTNLPTSTGQYKTSCVDLMTEFSQEGIFMRLHYPTLSSKVKKESEQWIPWIPHDKYTQGLACVVGLWVFIVRLAMWWYGGSTYIPCTLEGVLLPESVKVPKKKFPVVIFSHGFGGCRFLCSSILCELASQGYVVASLEHRDSSACATYFYKSANHRDRDERTWIPHNRVQFGAQHYTLRNKQVKLRRDECVKALDMLEKINKGSDSGNILNTTLDLLTFKGQLDMEQVTIMGHSFGGATALLALGSDSRFKQGVVLDGWMFPLKDEKLKLPQPLLFINSPSFHIYSNLTAMDKIIKQPDSAQRQLYIIKNATHETQTDTPFVLGYWLDWFKSKIDPAVGNSVNNNLIIRFLQTYTGTPDATCAEDVDRVLRKQQQLFIDGALPSPVPVRKGFFQALFS